MAKQLNKAVASPSLSLESGVRVFSGLRIMDRPEYQNELIKIMIERTDGVSNRQLMRAFNKRLAARISLRTIQRKLTQLNAKKHKPESVLSHKNEHLVGRLIHAMVQLPKR